MFYSAHQSCNMDDIREVQGYESTRYPLYYGERLAYDGQVRHGAILRFGCLSPATQFGPRSTTCQNGIWSNRHWSRSCECEEMN